MTEFCSKKWKCIWKGMSNTTLSLVLQTSTLTCKSGNNIRSFWRSLRVHLAQMVFWENQSGLTFIFIPMFMFVFYFLLRTFMTAILKHIINLYESGEQTKAEDYCTRVSGEIPTHPLFPIKRERAIYSRDCQSEDKKQSKDSCEKNSPSHSKLTPGLYLLREPVIYVWADFAR